MAEDDEQKGRAGRTDASRVHEDILREQQLVNEREHEPREFGGMAESPIEGHEERHPHQPAETPMEDIEPRHRKRDIQSEGG